MSTSSFEVLAYEPSPLGMLCLRRRELLREPGNFVTEITLNQEFLMSSYNTNSECALAELALEMHAGKDLRVLVGGLGLGYTTYAALNSAKVSAVEVVEFLPQVIGWLDRGLIPLSEQLNSEARLEVVQGDIYARLAQAPKTRYDLILIDVDHSPAEHLDLENANHVFYTSAGLERAKAHLTPGGILAIWSYAKNSPFAQALKAVFHEVRVEGIEFENKLVQEIHTDWLFFAQNE